MCISECGMLSDNAVQQYRACAIDLLGLGIVCLIILLYYEYKPSQSCQLAFYAIPTLHIIIQRVFHLLVPSHFYACAL